MYLMILRPFWEYWLWSRGKSNIELKELLYRSVYQTFKRVTIVQIDSNALLKSYTLTLIIVWGGEPRPPQYFQLKYISNLIPFFIQHSQ